MKIEIENTDYVLNQDISKLYQVLTLVFGSYFLLITMIFFQM